LPGRFNRAYQLYLIQKARTAGVKNEFNPTMNINFSFLLLLLLVVTKGAWAQPEEKYHRVKIMTGTEGLKKIAEKGVAIDHGEFKKGLYFITDLSDREIGALQELSIPYEIEIEDVATYYSSRNVGNTAERSFTDQGCIDCRDYPTPANFALGAGMGGFYTLAELGEILDSMQARFPDLISVKQVINTTATAQNNPIWMVKISDNPDIDEDEPQVLYTALHHAREPQSLSQLVFFMWYMLEHYATDPEVQYLIDHRELYFVPCVNPDGYAYNHQTNPNGGGMWRKNRKVNSNGTFGIDLNRNYGTYWGFDNQGSSSNPAWDTYRGTHAFSEVETQTIRDLCNSHQFRIALNSHTHGDMLIYPYGHIAGYKTADSLAFEAFAQEMTACNTYISGTADQTVGYFTNGDSDAWMYGEQSSKDKIFAFTPEIGSNTDGFWPASNRIIPIAKANMDMNLYAARLAGAFAELQPTVTPMINSLSAEVPYAFKRSGLDSGVYTVSLIPLSSNIAGVGNSKTYINPPINQVFNEAIELNLAGNIQTNEAITFALQWSHPSGVSLADTITVRYTEWDTLFYSNCNTTEGFTSEQWGISTTQYVSPDGSITDSPEGNYGSGNYSTITTTDFIDLSYAQTAMLQFQAKWQIEPEYDYAMVQVSTENGQYTALCGRYTQKGNSHQNDETAVYDGFQPEWVREQIDLSAYAGQKIKIRFTLVSDPSYHLDGIYIDDITVLSNHDSMNSVNNLTEAKIHLFASPNPAASATTLHYQIDRSVEQPNLIITDIISGKIVWSQPLSSLQGMEQIPLQNFASGVYLYKIAGANIQSAVKKLIVAH
jgi:carboxypeptidase T